MLISNPCLGIQAQLWSELIPSAADFEYMVFPRLLAVAERVWHKAGWEQHQTGGPDTETQLNADWSHFSNVLGHRELRRLDSKHIKYRIPPPGARFTLSSYAALYQQTGKQILAA